MKTCSKYALLGPPSLGVVFRSTTNSNQNAPRCVILHGPRSDLWMLLWLARGTSHRIHHRSLKNCLMLWLGETSESSLQTSLKLLQGSCRINHLNIKHTPLHSCLPFMHAKTRPLLPKMYTVIDLNITRSNRRVQKHQHLVPRLLRIQQPASGRIQP